MSLLQNIQTVKAAFAKLETIPFSKADELLKIVDAADRETLETIVRERIKFLWMPASTRLQKRYNMTLEQVMAIR